MSAILRARVSSLLPAPWRRRLRRMLGRGTFVGDYASWAGARKASTGYDSTAISQKTLAAARAVRDGHAAWERDTVLFHRPEANAPLVAALREAAAEQARLRVLDFGGALGSTWWQLRPWLDDFAAVQWNIVEQPELVAAGQREFTVGPLEFHLTARDCWARRHPDILLFSSVLPYLESPHAILCELAAYPFRHLIIDRTGFTRSGRDRLTVQRVPAAIYEASYPCWFFDQAALLEPLRPEWQIVRSWTTPDEVDIDAEYRGVYLRRK